MCGGVQSSMAAFRREITGNVGFEGAENPRKVGLKGSICPRKVCLKGCDSFRNVPGIVRKWGQTEPRKVRNQAKSLPVITRKEASTALAPRKKAILARLERDFALISARFRI